MAGTTTSAAPTGSPASHRAATVVALTVIAGTVMIPLDVTVVAVALARLSQETGAPLPVIQWVSTGYTLALAAVIPSAAWAIGRYGARRVFLGAVAVFTAASVLVACSWDAGSMIGFRVVQGMGGGFVMPAAMTLALRAADPERRGRVMSLLGLPILVGPVFGPPLGGWLMDTLSWRWIFLVNLPIGLVAIVLGLRNLPRTTGDSAAALDRRGILLLPPAMALLVLGTSLADGQLLRPVVIAPLLVGVLLVAVFVAHALRVRDPLLKVRLLGRRLTGGGALVLFLFAGGYFSTILLVPLYFQVARGESATTAGLLMMPQAVVAGISIQVSGRLVDRLPPARVIGTGIVLAVIGYSTFVLQLSDDVSYGRLVPALMLAAGGAGATLLPTMTTATRHLADADIPSGSTLINVLNQLAASITTAAVAVLVAAALSTRLPRLASEGDLGALQSMPATERALAGPAVAEAIQIGFLLPIGMMAAALVVAVTFLRRR